MRILHTADVHLQDLEDLRWQALKRIISICDERNVELLIISGDLFDSSANAEGLRPHIRELLSGGSFETVIIPGNHDHESFRPGFYFGRGVKVLNHPDWRRNLLNYGDLRLIGIPFQQLDAMEIARRLRELATHLPEGRINMLLYHGELLDAFFERGEFGPEETGRYMPVRLSSLAELPIDYVLAGHFHARFDAWRIGERGYFVYPGSPISITRRELGPRKVNLFEVGQPPTEYVLDTPHFVETSVRLNPFEDADPMALIRQNLSGLESSATALLTVTGYVIQDEEKLVEEINDLLADLACNIEVRYEFRDVGRVLHHPLFGMLAEELARAGCSDERKEQLREMALQAMIGAEI